MYSQYAITRAVTVSFRLCKCHCTSLFCCIYLWLPAGPQSCKAYTTLVESQNYRKYHRWNAAEKSRSPRRDDEISWLQKGIPLLLTSSRLSTDQVEGANMEMPISKKCRTKKWGTLHLICFKLAGVVHLCSAHLCEYNFHNLGENSKESVKENFPFSSDKFDAFCSSHLQRTRAASHRYPKDSLILLRTATWCSAASWISWSRDIRQDNPASSCDWQPMSHTNGWNKTH